MIGTHVEISSGGKSVTVPALEMDGNTVVVTGGWLKIAFIRDEDWMEGELHDLGSFVSRLSPDESHWVTSRMVSASI